MRKWKQENIYFILILLIIFGVFQYGIRKICGFSLYPDEFGYWASAAKTAGYDWSQVASLGSYYSFGYSLVLAPLLRLFSDGVTLYRSAIAVNMVLMCMGAWMIYCADRRLFPEADGAKGILVSGIAALYPSWILYMQTTMAEALLSFLYAAAVYFFICLIQKPQVKSAVFLAVLLIYSYSVHMRTIGVAIACVAVLLLWGIANPAMRKYIIAMLGAVLVAGIIVIFLKRNVILEVFSEADSETLAANDYVSQLAKIRDILSLSGAVHFLKEITGKIFYLGMATYGIFYWAMGWCIKETAELGKKLIGKRSGQCRVTNWTAAFLLLSTAGEILICSIFMHNSLLIDSLVYGRYNEFLVPVLLMIGMWAMLGSTKVVRINILLGALSGTMLFPIFSAIDSKNMERTRGYFIAGISSLLKEENGDPHAFLFQTWMIGFAGMLLIAGIIRGMQKSHKAVWLLGIVMAAEIMLGIQASEKYVYHANRFNFQDRIIVEKIIENRDRDIRVTYLEEGFSPYIDFHQMQLQDLPVHVIDADDPELWDRLGDYCIVSANTQRQEELEQRYDHHITANLNILYYNQP